MDRNRLIGSRNQLPWHLPADLAHFKKVTMGKPIIMGRKTYESIGRPLPGRTNIVLTRSADFTADGVSIVASLEQALAMVAAEDEAVIIGGSSIYELALPQVDRLYLTYIENSFEGDAWFPEFSDDDWVEVDSKTHAADDKNKYDCRFVTLERKST